MAGVQLAVNNTKWKIEPHTEAKHQILKGYLHQWFAKLAEGGYSYLTYIDGFSGPGCYESGEAGSPIIALDALINHVNFQRWYNKSFNFIFVEVNRGRFESLKHEVEQFLNATKPTNVNVGFLNESFEEAINRILAMNATVSNPFFAFVDPFGYTGIPIDLLSKVIAPPKSEMFLNLSTDAINRFFGLPLVRERLNALFGMEVEERTSRLKQVYDRSEVIANLYQEQLKVQTRAKYTWKFGMRVWKPTPLSSSSNGVVVRQNRMADA